MQQGRKWPRRTATGDVTSNAALSLVLQPQLAHALCKVTAIWGTVQPANASVGNRGVRQWREECKRDIGAENTRKLAVDPLLLIGVEDGARLVKQAEKRRVVVAGAPQIP